MPRLLKLIIIFLFTYVIFNQMEKLSCKKFGPYRSNDEEEDENAGCPLLRKGEELHQPWEDISRISTTVKTMPKPTKTSDECPDEDDSKVVIKILFNDDPYFKNMFS